eukprot:9742-Heterococcus_DN1.PRE.2
MTTSEAPSAGPDRGALVMIVTAGLYSTASAELHSLPLAVTVSDTPTAGGRTAGTTAATAAAAVALPNLQASSEGHSSAASLREHCWPRCSDVHSSSVEEWHSIAAIVHAIVSHFYHYCAAIRQCTEYRREACSQRRAVDEASAADSHSSAAKRRGRCRMHSSDCCSAVVGEHQLLSSADLQHQLVLSVRHSQHNCQQHYSRHFKACKAAVRLPRCCPCQSRVSAREAVAADTDHSATSDRAARWLHAVHKPIRLNVQLAQRWRYTAQCASTSERSCVHSDHTLHIAAISAAASAAASESAAVSSACSKGATQCERHPSSFCQYCRCTAVNSSGCSVASATSPTARVTYCGAAAAAGTVHRSAVALSTVAVTVTVLPPATLLDSGDTDVATGACRCLTLTAALYNKPSFVMLICDNTLSLLLLLLLLLLLYRAGTVSSAAEALTKRNGSTVTTRPAVSTLAFSSVLLYRLVPCSVTTVCVEAGTTAGTAAVSMSSPTYSTTALLLLVSTPLPVSFTVTNPGCCSGAMHCTVSAEVQTAATCCTVLVPNTQLM